MKNKVWMLCVLGLVMSPASVLHAGETKIGGHLKMNVLDYVDGVHNDAAGSQYGGFLGLTQMILYISQEISDKVSIDMQPSFEVSTGATPKLGSNLGDQREPNPTPEFSWVKLVMKALLPYETEVSVGIVKPRFTLEYGAEYFWQEELNGSKFAANPYLGAMHESGVEIYRTFEIGSVSVPTYLYLVNGNSIFGDFNRNVMAMLHVEPEIGGLKFTGSYAYGKWDASNVDDMLRYSAGAEYTLDALTVRGEFAGGKWANAINGSADAIARGYYLKLFYRLAPWVRVMLHYNNVDHNFNVVDEPDFSDFPTEFDAGPGSKYVTFTPGVQFTVAEGSLILVQWDIADWRYKDDSDKLNFKRLVVGWRTTF